MKMNSKLSKQQLRGLVTERLVHISRDESFQYTGKCLDEEYDSTYDYAKIIFWNDIIELIEEIKSKKGESAESGGEESEEIVLKMKHSNRPKRAGHL